jgi:hypothetical protein
MIWVLDLMWTFTLFAGMILTLTKCVPMKRLAFEDKGENVLFGTTSLNNMASSYAYGGTITIDAGTETTLTNQELPEFSRPKLFLSWWRKK